VLKELRIRNLAIFDAVTIPFSPGLNVLTGETGAGKSIMIDALGLLLGERVQPAETIRSGAENATIEAVFALPKKSTIPALLEAHGFTPEEGTLIVRRELVRAGRGRVFLNDSNATLAVAEKLGELLLEVHGQHDAQTLLRPSRHLDLLDAFGGLFILRDKLSQRWEEWKATSDELTGLMLSGRDKAERLDRYRAQLAEIDAARLRVGEEDELREERKRLQNAERLAEGATVAYQNLYDDPAAAATRLGQAIGSLRELAKVDGTLQGTVEALDVAAVQLDEAVRGLRAYRDGIVFDPPRLDEIERRLDEIGRLKRRHGDSVEGVLAARQQMAAECEKLAHGDEQERQVADRLEKLRAELATRAADLSSRR
jgi:DNA repair protein RecN (Recombination protein N)